MGLFDNIFADQNTATAMLDPLMTTQEKEAAAKASQDTTDKGLDTQAIVDTPVTDQDGIDNHSSLPLTDAEISFDIGGVDLPDFGAVTTDTPATYEPSVGGMFLSGGKALSASVSESVSSDMSTSDISIGLLQGATAGTSDAIMDITEGVTTELSPENAATPESGLDTAPESALDLTTAITVSESETLVKMEEIPPTDLQMDHVFTVGSSLMDMLGDGIPNAETIVPESISMETNSLIPDPSISLITPESMMATETTDSSTTTEVIHVDSLFGDTPIDDTTILSVITPTIADQDSPLHEMLREFIAKLEKLESGSDTLDIDMANAQAKIQAERIKLEDEYHDRLSAIQKEQQHITDSNIARQEEKNKLRKIIENLEKEIT